MSSKTAKIQKNVTRQRALVSAAADRVILHFLRNYPLWALIRLLVRVRTMRGITYDARMRRAVRVVDSLR